MNKSRITLVISIMTIVVLVVITVLFFAINNSLDVASNMTTNNNETSKTDSKKTTISKVSELSDKKSSVKKVTNRKEEALVAFKDENGNVISKQQVKKGLAAKEPSKPSKKGYYFYSWSRNFDKVTEDLEITPVFLKEGTSPQVIASRVNAKAFDKNVEVKISVKNNPGIASVSFDILYDKKHLKLKNFEYNKEALDGAITVPFNEKADPACVSVVNGTDNIAGDFDIATLQFDVLDNKKASYPIIISCDKNNVYNIDESNVEFELVNGLINVNN